MKVKGVTFEMCGGDIDLNLEEGPNYVQFFISINPTESFDKYGLGQLIEDLSDAAKYAEENMGGE